MEQSSAIPDLDIAAAKYTLNLLKSWELPRVADAALNRGQYSASLGELASLCDPIMSDAGPLFEASLAELNRSLPAQDVAIQLVLSYSIQLIATGSVKPYDGLHPMMQDVYYGANLYEQPHEYVGDSHDIHHLVGAYYGYDDLRGGPLEVSFAGKFGNDAITVFDAHVVKLANEWLARNAAR